MKLFNSFLTGKRTILFFDNRKPYCKGFLEAQIRYDGKTFEVTITDGFNSRYPMGGFMYLKEAVNWAKDQIELKAA